MRGFDTNVLVRYLVKDDPGQAAIVDRLIAQAVAEEEPVYINAIVLCEVVWVLESGYSYSRGQIADALEKLLLTQQFEFAERDEVWAALRRFKQGRADFADFLIGGMSLSNGCHRTTTFDRGLRNEDGFELLTA